MKQIHVLHQSMHIKQTTGEKTLKKKKHNKNNARGMK